MKVLLIDNYDSFTFNLYHYISSLGVRVDVFRNDKITAKDIKKNKYNNQISKKNPSYINVLKIINNYFQTNDAVCRGIGTFELIRSSITQGSNQPKQSRNCCYSAHSRNNTKT